MNLTKIIITKFGNFSNYMLIAELSFSSKIPFAKDAKDLEIIFAFPEKYSHFAKMRTASASLGYNKKYYFFLQNMQTM